MADSTGTLTVRVPGFPNPIQFADWTHDNLYHTVQFQQGNTNAVQAFTGAPGSAIPNGQRVLTLVDTNIPRSGDNGLSEGWEMLVYSIGIQPAREWATNAPPAQLVDGVLAGTGQLSRPVHLGGGDPAVTSGGILFDFLRKTYVKFTVNQKVQSEAPAEKYPQGSGMHVFATTTDIEIANNGRESPADARVFVLPIWLRANIAYTCILSPQVAYEPAPTNWATTLTTSLPILGFDVRVTLNGLLKRPVT